ncbi:MAG TPA: DUF3047 domain-containing protein [Methylomirabilota bacterium]|nr:DUF3047 domain-containing protein [Methylomirabilota bacterium]
MAPRALIARLLGVAVSAVVLLSAGLAPAAECVLIDDFSGGKIGEFPLDWKPRKEEGRPVYSLREAGGRRFLHAASRGIGIQAGREVAWDLDAYPILAWSWRAVEFPKGSDERKSATNDSAVSVYALFPGAMNTVKSMKYVWSRVVPVGTPLTSSQGRTQVRVLRSGTDRAGQWLDEQANVRDDYRKLFGDDPPKPAGIAVLTDADDTESSAQGDYASFRACKP